MVTFWGNQISLKKFDSGNGAPNPFVVQGSTIICANKMCVCEFLVD